MLETINKILEPIEKEQVSRFDIPKKEVIFIVGAPRSATTLLHQLVAQTGLFGYISNYLARFWAAPYIGGLQEKALGFRNCEDMSYYSDYGRTKGWNEPHQFNYYWHRWFQFDDNHQMNANVIENIDTKFFKQEIAALESIFNSPMVFKSLYCGLQIPFLKKTLTNAKFVICTRNPLYQAQSILLGRKAFFGNYDGWFSLKPPEYFELVKKSPYEQVSGQIFYTLRSIGDAISKLDESDFFIIDHADLIRNPRLSIRKIIDLTDVTPTDEVLSKIPENFDNRNKQSIEDEEWLQLTNAVDKMFEGRNSRDVILENR